MNNGNAYTSKQLPYGKFICKETFTPKDYESAQDFTFSITKDETEIMEVAQKVKHIVVNNNPLEAYIKLIKKDKATGKVVTLSNATFTIKANEDIYDRGTGKIIWKKGETIKQKVGSTTYSSFTTNAKNMIVATESYSNNKDILGTVTTPLKLPVGNYEITEIAPNGFIELEKPFEFKIEGIRDYEKDQDEDYIKEIVIENEQPTCTIKLNKEIAIRENVDTSLIDISDLSEIEFTLVAKENVIDKADGSIIYEKGKEIKKLNLSKDGKLEISSLPIGDYEIYESKTIDGLVLNEEKYEVKFTKKDSITKIYEETLDIKNYTTFVEISKIDITGQEEIEGAKLQVIDKDGNIVDSWTSEKEIHKVNGLKEGETYILHEEIVANEYVQATDIEFNVSYDKETQKIQMVDKVVEISKVNIAGEEIEGAELQVIDKDGNVVDSWTSGKEIHKVNGLREGETYILHEEIAVDGYVKATDIEFSVSYDKETQKIQMIDKVVEITKIDFTTDKELEGAELQIIDEYGNIIDSWTSTKEPHKVIGLEENKTYKLVEITSPYGYEIAEEIEFLVSLDKKTQKIEMKDIPILKNIKVQKIDNETKEIIKEKFAFGIYEDEECTKLIKEVYAEQELGIALFENLRYGIFYIKETLAPKNYELSNKIVKIDINDKGVFADDIELEENENAYTFEYENQKIETPKTGDERNNLLWISLLGISIMTFITLGIYMIIKRKKNK